LLARIQKRRRHGAERDHAAGEQVEPRRDPAAPEHDDPEEGRLQEERRDRLVAEQRPQDRAAPLGQHAPVGAELERHHDARDDTHAERHREHLEPEVEQPPVHWVAGRQRHALDGREPGGQSDRECRKDDVKRDDERELDPRQQYDVEIH
jgi:hypothetical protein